MKELQGNVKVSILKEELGNEYKYYKTLKDLIIRTQEPLDLLLTPLETIKYYGAKTEKELNKRLSDKNKEKTIEIAYNAWDFGVEKHKTAKENKKL